MPTRALLGRQLVLCQVLAGRLHLMCFSLVIAPGLSRSLGWERRCAGVSSYSAPALPALRFLGLYELYICGAPAPRQGSLDAPIPNERGWEPAAPPTGGDSGRCGICGSPLASCPHSSCLPWRVRSVVPPVRAAGTSRFPRPSPLRLTARRSVPVCLGSRVWVWLWHLVNCLFF